MREFLIGIIILIIVILFLLWVFSEKEGKEPKEKKKKDNHQYNHQNVSFFDPKHERRGVMAENYVNSGLSKILQEDERLLNNLIIRFNSGYETEVDTVLLTHKGVFVIDTKWWIGKISGTDDSEIWKQELRGNGITTPKKNPIKQNEGHCNAVRIKLGDKRIDVHNIIIMCGLEDGRGIRSNHVFELDSFIKVHNSMLDVFDSEMIARMANQLEKYVATPEELKAFKEEMKRKHSN
ncbi:MAG: NERD domain-containing protein [Bacilli bacterium]|nr:NERD domain-containing protein [Bacilli bacterium]